MQKLHLFFQQKYEQSDFMHSRGLNESLTNDVIKLRMLCTTTPFHFGHFQKGL